MEAEEKILQLERRVAWLEGYVTEASKTIRIPEDLKADCLVFTRECSEAGITTSEAWSGARDRRFIEARRQIICKLKVYGWAPIRIARIMLISERYVSRVLSGKAEPAKAPDGS